MHNYKSISADAQALAKAGFFVFPLHGVDENGRCTCGKQECGKSAGKHSLNLNWQAEATNDPKKAKALFESARIPNPNVGIATGSERGVFVVDCDSPEALDFVAKFGLPNTPTARSGNGRHFYFRTPNGVKIRNSQRKVYSGLDIRGEGGLIVAPPSRHYSGRSYEWDVSPNETPFADAPPELVFAIVRATGEGKTETPNPVSTVREERLSVGNSQTIDRLRKYLEKVPPAISGEGGHDHAFATVNKIVRNFGSELSDEELLIGLSAWNARCVPPWSEGELRHKIGDARKSNPQPDPTFASDSGSPDAVAGVLSSSETGQSREDEFPTLRPEAYYGLAGEFVKAIDAQTEAPPEGVLLALLTMFGSAVGKGPFCRVGSERHHANLYAAIVAGTGQGKGTILSEVDALMRRADPDWLKDCRCNGLSTGEGLIDRLADPEPTANGIVNPPEKRLLCIEPEFVRTITAMRREGNTLSAIVRNGWDSQPLEVLTKNPRRATNHHLSVIASITPSELREVLKKGTEGTNGFSNRFLWAFLRSEKCLPFADSQPIIESFAERFREALKTAKTIGELKRSDEANEHWSAIYPRLKRALSPTTERGRPQVLRLSMIFALIDGTETISVEHQKAALAIWEFCESSALRLFGGTDDDEGEDDSLDSRILRTIRKREGIARNDLRNAVGTRIKKEAYDSAYARLQSQGSIRIEVDRSSSRPTQRFYSGTETSNRADRVIVQPPCTITRNAEAPYFTAFSSVLPSNRAIVQSCKGEEKETEPATIPQILDWRNENGGKFFRRSDGTIWLASEATGNGTTGLPSEIAAGLTKHGEAFSGFLRQPEPQSIDPPTPAKAKTTDDKVLTDEEFYRDFGSLEP